MVTATDALSRAVSHRMPPPSLLAGAVMSTAKAAITLTAVLLATVKGGSPPGSGVDPRADGDGRRCAVRHRPVGARARSPSLGPDRAYGRMHRGGSHAADRPQHRRRGQPPRPGEHSDHRPHPHRRELRRGAALDETRSTSLRSKRQDRPGPRVGTGWCARPTPRRGHKRYGRGCERRGNRLRARAVFPGRASFWRPRCSCS